MDISPNTALLFFMGLEYLDQVPKKLIEVIDKYMYEEFLQSSQDSV